ncbi:hypothetical protein Gotur_007686 [Gossypium turneri]
MENEFLDKVEDNAAVQTWSETIQREKGDSLAKGYVSELWDFTRISVTQNSLQELKEIWDQWNDEVKQLFYASYGDLPYLLDIKVDKRLFRALAQFWNPVYSSHPDTKKKVDIFALSVYGLVVFPKALGHVDEAVTVLFDRLNTGVFSKNYLPLREIVAIPRRDDILEERLMEILQNLREEDIEWRAPWMLPDEILYRCGTFDWVPLLGIWGVVGYAPLLVLRQYRSKQLIPATQGLAQCEFSYKDNGYKKKIQEMSSAWNQTRRMKRLTVGLIVTPEYIEWWGRRINDNISGPSQGDIQPTQKHPQVVPSELEIIKQILKERMQS